MNGATVLWASVWPGLVAQGIGHNVYGKGVLVLLGISGHWQGKGFEGSGYSLLVLDALRRCCAEPLPLCTRRVGGWVWGFSHPRAGSLNLWPMINDFVFCVQ